MREWQVRLTYSRNLGERNDELVGLLDAVAEDLHECHAAITGGSDGLTLTASIEAPDHTQALQEADTRLRLAAGDHDLEPGDVIEVYARTWP